MTRRANRSSYSSLSRLKQNQNAYFINQQQTINILHAQINDQYLLICHQHTSIYNIHKMIKVDQIKKKCHCACFIPFSDYLVLASEKDREKREITIYDFKKKTVTAKINVKFIVQFVKATRRVIMMASLDHIYAIHFPSLKPIYQGIAGNGIQIICDISRQGFTLAHSSFKKGQIVIHNFTNIQTNRLLGDVRTRSRAQSYNQYYRATNSQIRSKIHSYNQDDVVKKQIRIQAHGENLSILRLSPNGYRVVSGSIKGSYIRLFSCLNGQLLTEYRMNYNFSPIVSLQFVPNGTQIICLNQTNDLNLFYTKMLDLQLLSENARKGYQIYEQQNPTSFFSFLGFLNHNLKSQYPFAHYKLDTRGLDIIEQKIKIQSEMEVSPTSKDSSKYINEIKEVAEAQIQEQHEENQEQKQVEGPITRSFENSRETPKIEISKEEVKVDQNLVEEPKYLDIFELLIPKRQLEKPSKSLERKPSNASNKFKTFKSNSVSKGKNTSIKSAGKLARKTSEKVTFGEKQRVLNFRGIVSFGSTTNIIAFQNKYLFKLKYDPFNGGQMVEQSNINLLKHQLFNDL